MKMLNLSQRELDTMIILERTKNRELKQEEAAQILQIGTRQLRRKLKAYKEAGAAGLISKKRGKPSNRRLPLIKKESVLKLLREKYLTLKTIAGPTFIADQLAKHDDIKIDHETLRKLMIREGLWEPSTRKKRHHQWRERKHHLGELVQVDGSYHIWFNNDYATLIAFIDDATGRIMAARFFDRESTENLAKLTQEYLNKFGRPLAVYSDRGSTYKVNHKIDGKRSFTQYHRMLKELDIELIHAQSPQAKGRVERLFKTMQDRLVKEFELLNISTIEAANDYLQKSYIPEHNVKFAVEPLENADFHRPINEIDLQSIFCLKDERTINNDYTVRYNHALLQLAYPQEISIRRGNKVKIHEHFDKTIDVLIGNQRVQFKRIVQKKPVKKHVAGKVQLEDQLGRGQYFPLRP